MRRRPVPHRVRVLSFAQVERHCACERLYLLACNQRTRRCHPILHAASVLVPLLRLLGNGDTRSLKKLYEADRSFQNIRSCSAGLRFQRCRRPSPWWANVKWLGGVQRAFVQFAACSGNCTNAGCTAQLHSCTLRLALRCVEPEASQVKVNQTCAYITR